MWGMPAPFRCKGCSVRIPHEFPWLCDDCVYKHTLASHAIDGHAQAIEGCYQCWKDVTPMRQPPK